MLIKTCFNLFMQASQYLSGHYYMATLHNQARLD